MSRLPKSEALFWQRQPALAASACSAVRKARLLLCLVMSGDMQAALRPYTTRLALLYVLLMADASINATVDAQIEPLTILWASMALVGQVIVRICCIVTTVGMLSSSRVWRDDFLLEFSGVFAVSLVGIIICLFLRVFRVVMAAFPSRFPTVLDYWRSDEYCLLLLAHVLVSLLFYYSSITAGHRMGRLVYFSSPERACATCLEQSVTRPSVYTAVHLASMRR